jgi:hypothetical protein
MVRTAEEGVFAYKAVLLCNLQQRLCQFATRLAAAVAPRI